jgi:hypothetical protein
MTNQGSVVNIELSPEVASYSNFFKTAYIYDLIDTFMTYWLVFYSVSVTEGDTAKRLCWFLDSCPPRI